MFAWINLVDGLIEAIHRGTTMEKIKGLSFLWHILKLLTILQKLCFFSHFFFFPLVFFLIIFVLQLSPLCMLIEADIIVFKHFYFLLCKELATASHIWHPDRLSELWFMFAWVILADWGYSRKQYHGKS